MKMPKFNKAKIRHLNQFAALDDEENLTQDEECSRDEEGGGVYQTAGSKNASGQLATRGTGISRADTGGEAGRGMHQTTDSTNASGQLTTRGTGISRAGMGTEVGREDATQDNHIHSPWSTPSLRS